MDSRFSKQANLYAKYRPNYPKAMYDLIFDHLDSTQTAWDCATGSGQVARRLAGQFDEVIATDISKEQLTHATKRENIEYQVSQAEASGLPENEFDLITVAQAIHWFNFDEFYQEVKRVANQGALLAVIGYGMVRINKEADRIIDKLYEEAFNDYFDKNRAYLDNSYRTLPFPFDEISTPAITNTCRWSLNHLQGYFNSWSAVQKIRTEQGYNPTNNAITQLEKEIVDPKDIELHFPVFLRLGRVS